MLFARWLLTLLFNVLTCDDRAIRQSMARPGVKRATGFGPVLKACGQKAIRGVNTITCWQETVLGEARPVYWRYIRPLDGTLSSADGTGDADDLHFRGVIDPPDMRLCVAASDHRYQTPVRRGRARYDPHEGRPRGVVTRLSFAQPAPSRSSFGGCGPSGVAKSGRRQAAPLRYFGESTLMPPAEQEKKKKKREGSPCYELP